MVSVSSNSVGKESAEVNVQDIKIEEYDLNSARLKSIHSKVDEAHVLTTQVSHTRQADVKNADATLHFQEQYDSQVPEITPEQEKKLSRKVCWFIITATGLMNLILFMIKGTLSYASLMEMWEDTGIDQNKYNNINTLFYVGYTAGQIPGNYLIQKLPVGRFAFILVSCWSILMFLTCVSTNYLGVILTRFFMGLVMSVAVPTMNTTLAQFLNANEKAASGPLFFSTCMAVTIPNGFIAYGVMYIHGAIAQWKIYFIIIGGLTGLLAAAIWFWYPNNPSTANFLTIEERIWVIRRVQDTTGTAVEQKNYKRYQMVECLKDPVSWLFGLYFLLLNLANNLPYQQNLLFKEMGNINNLDSTLVSVAAGVWAGGCSIICGMFLLKYPNASAFSTLFWSLPSLVGSVCAAVLPWENKIGILANLTMASPAFAIPWIIMFSWAGTSCSGSTKKMTRNIFTMFGYGIGNLISPQLWRAKDAPRYLTAWIVQIALSFVTGPLIALVIYFILKRRNAERLANIDENERVGVVEGSDGEQVLVNVAALDLTDYENKTFIYPL